VGGLYGVTLGGAFMGESMFSWMRDASKVCLVYLVERLEERGYVLLDCQIQTDHLASLGAVEIPEHEYLKRLKEALKLSRRFV
jgi:leucyl/phenylalanyl-tRNA---protein transferase